MKHLLIKVKGTKPLLMASCQGVNPHFWATREKAKLTAKRKKTDEDLDKIAQYEWYQLCYWDDNVGLGLPIDNILATILDGARAKKRGKEFEKGLDADALFVPLDVGVKLSKEEMSTDDRFRDVRCMKVMRSRVMRTRPRFNQWRFEVVISYDEKILDRQVIEESLDYAGSYIGLCDSRQRGYGRFAATVEELD